MRILVTNDDGIDSHGLHVLARAVSAHGEVTVIAPDREYSGALGLTRGAERDPPRSAARRRRGRSRGVDRERAARPLRDVRRAFKVVMEWGDAVSLPDGTDGERSSATACR